jgi:hypothetical protein
VHSEYLWLSTASPGRWLLRETDDREVSCEALLAGNGIRCQSIPNSGSNSNDLRAVAGCREAMSNDTPVPAIRPTEHLQSVPSHAP